MKKHLQIASLLILASAFIYSGYFLFKPINNYMSNKPPIVASKKTSIKTPDLVSEPQLTTPNTTHSTLNPQTENHPTTIPNDPPEKSNNPQELTPLPESQNSAAIEENPEQKTTKQPIVQINIIPGDISFLIEIHDNMSVLEAMKLAEQKEKITFKTKKYSYGELVEQINNLSNNKILGKYWTYYLNGQFAQVGISDQKLNYGDTIEWRYGE